jgi:hypothetical protein
VSSGVFGVAFGLAATVLVSLITRPEPPGL